LNFHESQIGSGVNVQEFIFPDTSNFLAFVCTWLYTAI